MEQVQEVLPWKNLITWTVGTADNPTTVSTAGETVTVKLTEYDVTGATPIGVGSDDGAAAGTPFTVELDLATNNIGAGFWIVEAIGDIDGTNPITVIPNSTDGDPFLVEIRVQESMPTS